MNADGIRFRNRDIYTGVLARSPAQELVAPGVCQLPVAEVLAAAEELQESLAGQPEIRSTMGFPGTSTPTTRSWSFGCSAR